MDKLNAKVKYIAKVQSLSGIIVTSYGNFWAVFFLFFLRRQTDTHAHEQTPLKQYLPHQHGWCAGNNNAARNGRRMVFSGNSV